MRSIGVTQSSLRIGFGTPGPCWSVRRERCPHEVPDPFITSDAGPVSTE
jgi:hypothetical protein